VVEYSEIKALNWSTLKVLHESAALCRHRTEHPSPDRSFYRLGRAVHCLTLEPEVYATRYAVCDMRRDARTKAYQKWCAAHPGVDALTESEGAMVEAMARAVREHPKAGPLLFGGRAEEVVTWTDPDTGIPCKGRLDLITSSYLVDLKTVEASGFRRAKWASEVASRLYHAQVAWYHDGAVAAGLLSPNTALPWIVRVKKAPSGEEGNYLHEAACDQLSERSYNAGRAVYRALVQQYAGCQAAGRWDIAYPDAGELEVPEWAPGISSGASASSGEEW